MSTAPDLGPVLDAVRDAVLDLPDGLTATARRKLLDARLASIADITSSASKYAELHQDVVDRDAEKLGLAIMRTHVQIAEPDLAKQAAKKAYEMFDFGEFVGVDEAADIIGTSPAQVSRWFDEGVLPVDFAGTLTRRVNAEALAEKHAEAEELAASRPAEPDPEGRLIHGDRTIVLRMPDTVPSVPEPGVRQWWGWADKADQSAQGKGHLRLELPDGEVVEGPGRFRPSRGGCLKVFISDAPAEERATDADVRPYVTTESDGPAVDEDDLDGAEDDSAHRELVSGVLGAIRENQAAIEADLHAAHTADAEEIAADEQTIAELRAENEELRARLTVRADVIDRDGDCWIQLPSGDYALTPTARTREELEEHYGPLTQTPVRIVPADAIVLERPSNEDLDLLGGALERYGSNLAEFVHISPLNDIVIDTACDSCGGAPALHLNREMARLLAARILLAADEAERGQG